MTKQIKPIFKVGDIVEDHIGIFVVIKVKPYRKEFQYLVADQNNDSSFDFGHIVDVLQSYWVKDNKKYTYKVLTNKKLVAQLYG